MKKEIKEAMEYVQEQKEGFLFFRWKHDLKIQEAWILVNRNSGKITLDYNNTTSSSLTRDVADGEAIKLYIDSTLTNQTISILLKKLEMSGLYDDILDEEFGHTELTEKWEELVRAEAAQGSYLSVVENLDDYYEYRDLDLSQIEKEIEKFEEERREEEGVSVIYLINKDDIRNYIENRIAQMS